MTDAPSNIARATALLAVNAFVLIQVMGAIQASSPPPLFSLLMVAVPLIGMWGSYSMLEPPKRAWDERFALGAVVIMLLLWINWRVF
jgi:hypothetical protein